MSIKSNIKNSLNKTELGKVLFFKARRIREKMALLKSDEDYISFTYKKRFKKDIDFINPTSFQEKLQWLKLFYRDDWMPICSDKYEVRKYLKQFNCECLANIIIGVYEDAKDIPFDKLPTKFVAKATHGSGWNIICKDKAKLKWKNEVKLMNSWLKLDLSVFGREWNYKHIKPRIIIEEYIEQEPLNDYKLMCFNGEPIYMQLNNDFEGKHYVDFYEIKTWKHLPVTYSAYEKSSRLIEKPENLDKMIEIARILCKRFPFVRIDFYSFAQTIILGELTFFLVGGCGHFRLRKKGLTK